MLKKVRQQLRILFAGLCLPLSFCAVIAAADYYKGESTTVNSTITDAWGQMNKKVVITEWYHDPGLEDMAKIHTKETQTHLTGPYRIRIYDNAEYFQIGTGMSTTYYHHNYMAVLPPLGSTGRITQQSTETRDLQEDGNLNTSITTVTDVMIEYVGNTSLVDEEYHGYIQFDEGWQSHQALPTEVLCEPSVNGHVAAKTEANMVRRCEIAENFDRGPNDPYLLLGVYLTQNDNFYWSVDVSNVFSAGYYKWFGTTWHYLLDYEWGRDHYEYGLGILPVEPDETETVYDCDDWSSTNGVILSRVALCDHSASDEHGVIFTFEMPPKGIGACPL